MRWVTDSGMRCSHAVTEGERITLCGLRVAPGAGGLPRPHCRKCEEIARTKRAAFLLIRGGKTRWGNDGSAREQA